MARRCGFYLADDKVRKVEVDIAWDKGFTFEAKKEYISEIYQQLEELGFTGYIDVTSANRTQQRGYLLSPIFIKQNGVPLEDVYKELTPEMRTPEAKQIFFTWLYISNLEDSHWQVIMSHDVFVDVFHRPGEQHTTQAKACAVAKLMRLTDKVGMLSLDRFAEFVEYYNQIGYDT